MDRTPLPELFARSLIRPDQVEDLLRRGEVGVLVVDATAMLPDLTRQVARLRAAGVPVPVIEVVPGPLSSRGPLPFGVDARVARDRAHLDRVDISRGRVIGRVLAAASHALRQVFHPVHAADVAICAVRACDPPFQTVGAVADFAGCTRRTLSNHWLGVLGRASSAARVLSHLRFTTFVADVVFLRVLAGKRFDGTWEPVATRFGTTYETMRKHARRFGRPLDVLEKSEPLHAVKVFERDTLTRFGVVLPWGVPV